MNVRVLVLDTGLADAERCAAQLRRAAPDPAGVRTCDASPAAVNEEVASGSSDVVVLVPSFVEPGPDLVAMYAGALADRPAAAIAYGDYTIHLNDGGVVTQTILAHRSDLSEWSATGYVTAARTSTFLEVGGYDPDLSYAAEYDLRLRLTRNHGLVRVEEPLYDLSGYRVDFNDANVRTHLRRWFTPESSPLKGMGYLFQDRAEREEIDRVFERELRARCAWLDGPTEPLSCRHGASPLVSVVIPVHDRASLVRRAIDSVLGGTFADFEVLVVDGGSTDGTVEVVEEVAARDARVRLLRNPENRIAQSLNIGIRAARGRYVAQLDSDDEYVPVTLERMVAGMEAHPDWGLGISYYDFIDADGATLEAYGTIRHSEYDRNAILRTNGAGAVRVWHRCVLEEVGGFDEDRFGDYAEDYDLVMRVAERWAVGRVHEVLYRCRLHGSNNEEQRSTRFRAHRKSLARMLALQRRELRNGLRTSDERPALRG